jgi:hypothetical protein
VYCAEAVLSSPRARTGRSETSERSERAGVERDIMRKATAGVLMELELRLRIEGDSRYVLFVGAVGFELWM